MVKRSLVLEALRRPCAKTHPSRVPYQAFLDFGTCHTGSSVTAEHWAKKGAWVLSSCSNCLAVVVQGSQTNTNGEKHTILYCAILYYTIPYHTILYCTVLYCTVLYCTGLYYTVLRLWAQDEETETLVEPQHYPQPYTFHSR